MEAYLNQMTKKRNVSANIQSVALNAIEFLYREVLKMEMPCLEKLRRIKRYKSISVVMSQRELELTLANMDGTTRMMAEPMYGSGLCIGECAALRVKDIDFDLRSITDSSACPTGRNDLKSMRAYLLKEDFQQFWDYVSPVWAGKFLDQWTTRVMRSRIEPLKREAKTIRRHKDLILNWFVSLRQPIVTR